MRRFFDTSGPYAAMQKAANVPQSFVIIQRINLGLYAIFGELHATGNWRRIAEELWPFVDGPPSTPMGERIDGGGADGDRESHEREAVGDDRRAGHPRPAPTSPAPTTAGSTATPPWCGTASPRCPATPTTGR